MLKPIKLLLPAVIACSIAGGCSHWWGTQKVRAPIATGPAAVDPAEQSAMLTEAGGLAESGEYDSALQLFHDVLEDDPTSAPAYIGIGDIHLDQGDYERPSRHSAVRPSLNPETSMHSLVMRYHCRCSIGSSRRSAHTTGH